MLAWYSRNMLSNDLLERIKLPFRKEKELYLSLYGILGFYPRNLEYYKTALLHSSVAKRNEKGKPVNNERLEFLGDSILSSVVSDIVFQHFPGKREGFLTNTRSKLVQRNTLGKLASEMGIDSLINMGIRNKTHNSYIGGNAFEALVGAIYLDRGYDACMGFVKKRILKQMINLDKMAYKEVNFKSKLLEWTQKNRVRIEFLLLSQKKDENGNPMFEYQVILEGVEGCSATGYSKKESQQMASKLTLEQLRRKPQFIDEVFAAKSNRTKMEEEPATAPPKIEEETQKPENTVQKLEKTTQKTDKNAEKSTSKGEKSEQNAEKGTSKADKKPVQNEETEPVRGIDELDDEFDLSDITAREQSREEIIAAAEAAAYEA